MPVLTDLLPSVSGNFHYEQSGNFHWTSQNYINVKYINSQHIPKHFLRENNSGNSENAVIVISIRINT